MRKLATPRWGTLPNGWTFLARYKRVATSELPATITMARRYRGKVVAGRRRTPSRKRQSGSGFFDNLKKIAKYSLVQQLGKKALP